MAGATENPTRVVNVRGRVFDPDVVYVGRGSEWGNPYSHSGTKSKFKLRYVFETREEAIEAYRRDLWLRLLAQISQDDYSLVYALADLYGQTLGCYCTPLPCHADVLAAAAEWAENEVRNIEIEEENS